jgi:hypothetical protein
MTKLTRLAISMIAVVSIAGASGVAAAQSLSIANNDGVFVDRNSFKVVPGKATGNASALSDELDARDLGPGTIIFRSGNRLYLVDAPTVEGIRLGSDRRDYGSDRRDYGSDRRDYGSDRYGSDRRDYGSDRYGSDRRDYGSDRRDYANDSDQVVVHDAEYAQYKLKKIFTDNWVTGDSK